MWAEEVLLARFLKRCNEQILHRLDIDADTCLANLLHPCSKAFKNIFAAVKQLRSACGVSQLCIAATLKAFYEASCWCWVLGSVACAWKDKVA
jgi:hypothetical protein